ncbi:MAG: hypothetical protein Q8P82_01295 [bacterium]|nr:hypothetical protein [bacterium]
MLPIPLYLQREEDQDAPDEALAYIVGCNGVFVQKRTPVYRAVVPTKELPMLAEVPQMAEYFLPSIPPHIAAQIIGFFRQVFVKHRSEALMYIAYNSETGVFRLHVPKQTATGGRCRTEEVPMDSQDGFMWIGTVHSHASMSAFHSGIDKHEEETFDGIHTTVGYLDRKRVDIISTLSVSGQRFPQAVERIFAGVRKERDEPKKPIVISQPPPQRVARTIHTAPVRHTDPFETMLEELVERFPRLRKLMLGQKNRRRIAPSTVAVVSMPRTTVQPAVTYHPPYDPEGYVVDVPVGTPEELCAPDPSWIDQVLVPQYTTTYVPVTTGRRGKIGFTANGTGVRSSGECEFWRAMLSSENDSAEAKPAAEPPTAEGAVSPEPAPAETVAVEGVASEANGSAENGIAHERDLSVDDPPETVVPGLDEQETEE